MKNTPPSQSISLHYREGNSDKVYHVQLVEVEGGYVVNFQYAAADLRSRRNQDRNSGHVIRGRKDLH